MLLDRVDIDRHGPLSRVELGPFSEQLNVVCGPEGSGKTAIARFIRDSLIRRNYPLGMMSSSSGRVVWADRNGKIHCRREQDGTRDGRRTIEFESRGDHQHRFDWLHDSWIKGIADSTDASRALESIRIPESIVDGIITDTAVTSVSRVVDACLRSGLTDPSLFASLPINSSRVSGMSPEVATQRESERLIRDELARIESELATCSYPHSQTDSTLARRRELEARLAFLESRRRMPMNGPSTPTASAELAGLHDRIWQLRVRHSELSRWLDHLRVDQNRVRYQEPLTASPYANNALSTAASLDWNAHRHLQVDAQIRERLVALDDQLIRWRRMLTELRGLRDTLVAQRSSLEQSLSFGAYPLTDDLLRRERMNHFLKSLDRRGAEADARLYAPSTITGHWPDDIDLRIESVIRHVDWLASHYDRAEAYDFSWYKPTPALHRGDEGSLLRSLQSIREELQDVRRRGFRFHPTSATQREVAEQNAKLIDLQHTERWIVASIESLLRHRESLIQDHQWAASVRYPSWLDDTYHHQPWSPWYTEHLSVEVARCTRDLERVASELDQCVSRAERLRMEMRSLPVLGYDTYLDPALEMQRIQADLAAMQTPSIDARHEWLLQRRAELRSQLGSPQPVRASALPLADEASQWLVRLSAGRLKRVDWNPSTFTTRNDGPANATSRPGLVTIDGREEANCPAVDRALASLAVRMASADLLGRTGRPVPLVIESHRELLRPLAASYGESGPVALPYTALPYTTLPHTALPHTALPHDANNTVIAALHDFASLGRQVIVLTSDRVFADQVGRRGGFTQFIHGENIAHQHQPLWEPHFATEHYAGPYGDVYAAEGPRPVGTHPGTPLVNRYYDEPASFYAPMNAADVMPANAYSPTQVSPAFPSSMPPLPPAASVADINRRLDVIWQESQRPMRETPVRSDWHDGYYYSQSYTTTPQNVTSSASRPTEATNEPVKSPRQSPFFLTVDSPIDQAPSVDAVAASRLRALDVTHVNHLMQQDPNRLSDALGLAGVTAATIRRWQAECRLVCHVPQLRGFDARVLVGSGITDAADLAATDPNDLLDRVEAFLATERGQRILLSGTSYELSRITSWIAAANVSTEDHPIVRMRDHHTIDGRVVRESLDYRDGADTLDSDRYEYEFVDDHGEVVRARSRRRTRSRSSRRTSVGNGASHGNRGALHGGYGNGAGNGYGSGSGNGSGSGIGYGSGGGSGYGNGARSSRASRSRSSSRSRSARGTSQRSAREYEREPRTYDREPRSNDRDGRDYDREGRTYESRDGEREREGSSRQERRERRSERSSRSESVEHHETELRFYLQRESPVVDAPSIGNRMAEKLEAVGVYTVNDLLNANAAELAEMLDHRRIDAETIIAWQQQAALVCRVPMLRGHDAQLLVAAEVTTPEEVAAYDPETLLGLIDPIARSNEGKRIIRGGKLPDLEEITEWIGYAAQNRDLMAA